MYLNYCLEIDKLEKEMVEDLDFAIQSQDDELLLATERLVEAVKYHREDFGLNHVEWLDVQRGEENSELYLNIEFEQSCDDYPLYKLAEYVFQTPFSNLDHCRDGRFLTFSK